MLVLLAPCNNKVNITIEKNFLAFFEIFNNFRSLYEFEHIFTFSSLIFFVVYLLAKLLN